VCTQAWQTDCLCDWRLLYFEFVQLRAQIEQQLCIESGSDLPREDEVVVFVIPNQQRAKSYSLALRIRETTENI
jgi:hypothetical protein